MRFQNADDAPGFATPIQELLVRPVRLLDECLVRQDAHGLRTHRLLGLTAAVRIAPIAKIAANDAYGIYVRVSFAASFE